MIRDSAISDSTTQWLKWTVLS